MCSSELAKDTGGEAFLPESLKDVAPVCERIAHDIRNQYTLSYVPTNRNRDGTYRVIQVKAKLARSRTFVVRTRTGYFAPSALSASPAAKAIGHEVQLRRRFSRRDTQGSVRWSQTSVFYHWHPRARLRRLHSARCQTLPGICRNGRLKSQIQLEKEHSQPELTAKPAGQEGRRSRPHGHPAAGNCPSPFYKEPVRDILRLGAGHIEGTPLPGESREQCNRRTPRHFLP